MGLTVVLGPPAAGKSTWVRHRAQPGDIVIDYDALAVALTGPGAHPHDHPRALRDVAAQARKAAITTALKHAGAINVFIIHTHPSTAALALYRRHGAELVTVDPGRATVLRRCREERPAATLRAVRRWYAAHSPSGASSSSGGSRRW